MNPFLFPPDTDFRFLLLIVAVASASLFIFGVIYNAIFDQQIFTVIQDCLARTPFATPERPDLSGSALDRMGNMSPILSNWSATNQVRKACIEGWELAQGLAALGGLAAVLAMAFAIYWLTPTLKRRQLKLSPLTADDAPEALAYLHDLCEETGLRTKPDFVWNPLDGRVSGLAFGHLRRKFVAVSGGLVSLFYSDRTAFRAIALHELAHLRNGDVDKTYFSLAIWPAFVLAALLPFIVVQLVAGLNLADLMFFVQVAWRIVALALLIVLLRNAILRARELYADVRASAWDGPDGKLRNVLAERSTSAAHDAARGLQTLFQKHPSGARRIASLEDTRGLFATSTWDALATGLAAALAFTSVFWLVVDLLPVTVEILASTAALLVLGPLVAGIVCLAVWRDVFASVHGRHVHLRYFTFAVAMTVGLIIGRWLGATSAIQDDLFGGTSRLLESLAFFAWWGVWLVIGLYLFMLAVADGARAWIEAAHDAEGVTRLARRNLIVAAISLSLWLSVPFMFLSMSDFPAVAIVNFAGALLAIGSPFIGIWRDGGGWINLILFASMWAVPLVAGLRRRAHQTRDVEGRWAFLDDVTATAGAVRSGPVQFRITYTAQAGFVAGLACLFIIIALRYLLRLSMDEATRSSDDAKLALMQGIVFASAIAQALIAMIAAGRVKELKLAHGLFAAFVAGLTIVLGFLATNVILFEGSLNASFLESILLQVLNTGAWLALPLLGAVIGTAKRRQRAEASQHLPAQP
ncbi:MAG: M48 family metalloprotease [Candidatus Brachytrichaceae bacterium NZ_4S206]